ncbi:MAG: hypothetical protein HW391_196 [Chloroflexi bacterium]|nr:hypothetical protein [Chloroflexota bacterium]
MPSSITATATVTPAAPTAVPLPTPSEEPTATPAPLPAAVLETVDGFVAGTLGSYGIDGRGGDAPWLPFDSLPVVTLASGGIVVARLVDGVAIGQAIAVVAAQDDAAGLHLREVMVEMIGASADKVTIGPLPAGSWVLAVRLFRADGRGDGQTYWAVTVP